MPKYPDFLSGLEEFAGKSNSGSSSQLLQENLENTLIQHVKEQLDVILSRVDMKTTDMARCWYHVDASSGGPLSIPSQLRKIFELRLAQVQDLRWAKSHVPRMAGAGKHSLMPTLYAVADEHLGTVEKPLQVIDGDTDEFKYFRVHIMPEGAMHFSSFDDGWELSATLYPPKQQRQQKTKQSKVPLPTEAQRNLSTVPIPALDKKRSISPSPDEAQKRFKSANGHHPITFPRERISFSCLSYHWFKKEHFFYPFKNPTSPKQYLVARCNICQHRFVEDPTTSKAIRDHLAACNPGQDVNDIAWLLQNCCIKVYFKKGDNRDSGITNYMAKIARLTSSVSQKPTKAATSQQNQDTATAG